LKLVHHYSKLSIKYNNANAMRGSSSKFVKL